MSSSTASKLTDVCLTLGGLLLVASLVAAAQGAPWELTDLQKARAEILLLKAQLAQCETRATNQSLSAEQAVLLEDFRKTLKPKPGQVFDWKTLTFVDPPKAP